MPDIDPAHGSTIEVPPEDMHLFDDALQNVELARVRSMVHGRLFGSEQPTLIGRYEILERLGAGGMGVVYLAADPDLDRRVALKLLRNDAPDGSQGLGRMQREAKAMARLSHPNVVHVYEVGTHEGTVFISMEYVPGPTLRAWAVAETRPWSTVLAMHVQAGRGLAAAHRAGLVHRDYKPDNVLVDVEGRARVLDFGLARLMRPGSSAAATLEAEVPADVDLPELATAGGPSLTRTGALVGTPAYMAPEQLRGHVADPRSDQYAFCVALFEALFGTRPFAGDDLASLLRASERGEVKPVDLGSTGVPEAVHRALLRGLTADPSRRHPSMDDLLAALEQAGASPKKKSTAGPVFAGLAIVGAAMTLALVGLTGTEPTDAAPVGSVELEPHAEIFASSELPELLPEPLPNDPLGVTVHRLSNGLTVFISTRRDKPRIFAHVVVRAGADHEPDGSRGAAHVLEHMLLKGTPKLGSLDWSNEQPALAEIAGLLERWSSADASERESLTPAIRDAVARASRYSKPSEISDVLVRLGGTKVAIQAHASHTTFAVDVPSPRFEAWARLTAEMLRHPSYRSLVSELSVVAEELRSKAHPMSLGMLVGRSALFPGSQSEVSMDFAELERLTLGELQAFHRARYLPNNTAIVLVGDVDAEKALPILERHFGSWAPAPLGASGRTIGPGPTDRVARTVEGTFPAALMMAWRAPSADDPIREDFDALVQLMVHERQWFADQLVRNGPLSIVEAAEYGSMLLLIGAPRPGRNPDEPERSVMDALRRLADQGLPAELAAELAAEQEFRQLQWANDPASAAELLATSYGEGRPWRLRVSGLDGSRNADERIVRAAKWLLEHGYVVISGNDQPVPHRSIALPDAGAATHPIEGQSAEATAILAMANTPLEPQFFIEGRDYDVQELEGGAVSITARSTSGLYAVDVVYRFGSEDHRLACDAARALEYADTPTVGWKQRAASWKRAGTRFRVTCDNETVTIHGEGLERTFDESWPSIEAWIRTAAVSEGEMDRVRAALADERRALSDSPQFLATAFQQYLLQGERSVFVSGASEDEVRKVSARELNDVLAMMRRTAPDVLFSSSLPRQLELPPSGPPLPPRPPRPAKQLETSMVFVIDDPRPELSTVTIVAGFPWSTEDAAEADLFRMYFGTGPSAALIEDLRHARGESYAVDLDVISPTRRTLDGLVVTTFEVLPSKVASSTERTLGLLRGRVDPHRVEDARRSLEEHYRTTRLSASEIPREVYGWRARGFEVDPRLQNWGVLSKLDVAAFEAFQSKAMGGPVLIGIHGDASKLDFAALGQLGKVRRISAKEVSRWVDAEPGRARSRR